MSAAVRPLLICSLGNPGYKYALTRHSAGHILLKGLIRHTGAPPLVKDRRYGDGLVSWLRDDVCFWSSDSYMNTSGPGVAAALAAYSQDLTRRSQQDATTAQPALIVLFDDMEMNAGRFKVKPSAGNSPRGHNGLKSMMAVKSLQTLAHWRVPIGIGPRPVSRDQKVV